jgi:histone-lysine N-methyltransferase SUV39H
MVVKLGSKFSRQRTKDGVICISNSTVGGTLKSSNAGLRSPEPLKKGTLIDLYLGEVIGPEEAERRAKKASKRGISYLFDLDKFALDENEDEGAVGRSGLPLDEEDPTVYTVDGQYYGGVTRFVNHSCDPNLWVYAVMSDRRDGKVYDLALFTNRAIPAYEELTFCYVKTSEPEDKGTVTWPCYCGSVNCVEKLW